MELIVGGNISKIPSGISSIAYGAFCECKDLKSIEIPKSVTYIDSAAFQGCSGIEHLTVESGNSKYDSRGNCNAIIEKESNVLIFGCKTTNILDGVEIIGKGAFKNCSELENVVIPDSVKAIDYTTFEYCSKLTSIIIPNSVTSIGWNTFNGCSELTNITIPNSVTSIGENAFSDCVKLSSINIPDNITNINRRAFSGCSNLSTVTYKGSVYKSKLELESALKNNGVTIGSDVFVDTSLN